jgi:hypothetical protein
MALVATTATLFGMLRCKPDAVKQKLTISPDPSARHPTFHPGRGEAPQIRDRLGTSCAVADRKGPLHRREAHATAQLVLRRDLSRGPAANVSRPARGRCGSQTTDLSRW